jgi:hypothetical protein
MATADPVAFVDTESLGLDADVHPIWELALILPDGSEHVWQIDVTPRELSLAHPIALEIGRFEERYDPHVAEAACFVIAEFAEMTEGLHLAGAVVSFDEERLRRLAWKHGVAPGWHYHIVDVEALAIGYLAGVASVGGKGYLAGTPRPPWKSDELTAALGITVPEESKHTALGDARWARAVWTAVMGES